MLMSITRQAGKPASESSISKAAVQALRPQLQQRLRLRPHLRLRRDLRRRLDLVRRRHRARALDYGNRSDLGNATAERYLGSKPGTSFLHVGLSHYCPPDYLTSERSVARTKKFSQHHSRYSTLRNLRQDRRTPNTLCSKF